MRTTRTALSIWIGGRFENLSSEIHLWSDHSGRRKSGAESDADREATLQNFDLAWSNRLNNKKTGRIILIMQRLHHRDLTGHLIAKNLGYEVVKIPSICEKKTIITFPISGSEFKREPGDLMYPARDGSRGA